MKKLVKEYFGKDKLFPYNFENINYLFLKKKTRKKNTKFEE